MKSSKRKSVLVERPENAIKCVVLGDGRVGKTALLTSYFTDAFPSFYNPTAFDEYKVSVEVDKVFYSLQFCDTAGQEDFDALRPLCYPSTNVFIVCFSVVSPTSFANVEQKWLPEIRRYSRSVPVVLVGTHCDLRTDVKELIRLSALGQEPITGQKVKPFLKKAGIVCYIETSSVTRKNIKSIFDEAIINGLRPPTPSKRSDRGCRCSVM